MTNKEIEKIDNEYKETILEISKLNGSSEELRSAVRVFEKNHIVYDTYELNQKLEMMHKAIVDLGAKHDELSNKLLDMRSKCNHKFKVEYMTPYYDVEKCEICGEEIKS